MDFYPELSPQAGIAQTVGPLGLLDLLNQLVHQYHQVW